MKNVFQLSDKTEILERIQKLTPNTQRKWGKMTVAQMLAHLNVSYEMIYEDKHPKPNFLMGLILKYLVKNMVVNEKPYKQNGQTAPAFIIKDDKDFETEKNRLIDYVNKTQELGEAYFNGKESHSFGSLNKTEWNNLLYKHLNHHLTQFGV